jgi:hypothetical protein
LNYKRINTTNRFFVADECFTVGKIVGGGWYNLGAEDVGYLVGKLLVRSPTYDH